MVMETPQRAVPDGMIGQAIGHPARPPATVRVAIGSRPSGATVIIDGERRGTTPCVGQLARRKAPVEIQLTLPGYLPATRKVAAEAGVALSLSLDRAPQGALPTPGDTSSPR
jgi:eukaryotic-like serine/threonine-protein kinase